ncbi:adenosine deaminase [Tropicimonas sp. TH_r6]|uniref:adenosine deaminase n=1 Tax=Tropicimonas sp. TH_r6 TaxID=3082085 RepID=UPI002955DBB9|nr:adenosine deaminase [Tropicimonas sp. TH_r6]MDV7145053.1 adenosine deaminase [Tropicimonas sp. TH_r6]
MTSSPRIELHLHLEGAAQPAFIRSLAAEKNVDLSSIFDESGSYAYDGFVDFLRVYEAATSVLQTPEDYARLTTSVLEGLAAQDVIYAETFISPDFCGGGDLAAWREYLAAIQEASAAIEAQGGPILRGIVTPIRHFGPERAKAPAMCAAETAGDWIVGLGMGGDENNGHPRDFTWAFDCAREAGLRLTNHAGEWRGPDSVRESIEDLGVERIGHGVRAIEDPALVEYLAASGIVLEVCPGSNVALGVYPDWASHPIAKLRAAGVKVTVSTDDPPFFHTTLTHEYERLAETFGWGEDDFAALNRVAAEAAFCDSETRSVLLKKLEHADV